MKQQTKWKCDVDPRFTGLLVAGVGVEPTTLGFSVPCSTS